VCVSGAASPPRPVSLRLCFHLQHRVFSGALFVGQLRLPVVELQRLRGLQVQRGSCGGACAQPQGGASPTTTCTKTRPQPRQALTHTQRGSTHAARSARPRRRARAPVPDSPSFTLPLLTALRLLRLTATQ
jgi:hypothetical protein